MERTKLENKPILVVQTAFLGDLLLGVALLREIRRARPKSPLHLVCRKGFGTLIKGLGLVDEIHEIEKGSRKTYLLLKDRLSDLRFEWILCPHPSIRSALFVQSLKAKHKVSFKRWWNLPLFTNRVKSPDLPDPLRQASLLSAVVPAYNDKIKIWQKTSWNKKDLLGFLPEIPDDISIDCRGRFASHSPIAPIAPRTWAIFPGSVWATKQWPEEHFYQLAKKLLESDISVLWMGGKEELEICRRLTDRLPGSRNLAGSSSLWESLVLLSRCEAVISNDSGGQHLAAVAGAPVLSIYGPTVLDFGFRPWTKLTLVAERELFCRPCGPHGHRKCPRGTHECMTELSPETVFRASQELTRKLRQRLHR